MDIIKSMEGLASAYFLPLLVFGALFVVAIVYWLRHRAVKTELDIQRRSRLMSPAERNFFDCLMPALGEDFFVFPRISMLDVVAANRSIGFIKRRGIKKNLAGLHFDYILCKKIDLTIFGVIELENFEKTNSSRQRSNREKLVNAVCKAAHLRLFYFDIRQDYQNVDIRRLVTGFSSKPKEPEISGVARSQFTIDNSSYAAFAKQRTCPQCNGEVVTKVAVKGKRIGEKFIMCRKYPYCDYRVAMNDKSVARAVNDKSSVGSDEEPRPGFSDWSAG